MKILNEYKARINLHPLFTYLQEEDFYNNILYIGIIDH